MNILNSAFKMRDESHDYTCTIQYEQTLECSVTMRKTFIIITLKNKGKDSSVAFN